MEEAILAADPANAARITVVLGLIVVVEEIAYKASVLPEADAALLAVDLDLKLKCYMRNDPRRSTNLLASLALRADQLLELFPVERVALGVIVTEATAVDLPTTWTLQRTMKQAR